MCRVCAEKSKFVGFLGHVVFDPGLEVDPWKTEAAKNWQNPLTPTNIRSFLGLAGFYHMFCGGIFFHCCPTYIFDEEESQV